MSNEEHDFNYRLLRARSCVECAFRILIAKWQLLKIEINVDKTERIVK
jgi:hypothetical protein